MAKELKKLKSSEEKLAQLKSLLLKAEQSREKYKLRDTSSLLPLLSCDASNSSLSSQTSYLSLDSYIPSLPSLSETNEHPSTSDKKISIPDSSSDVNSNILPSKTSLPEIEIPKQESSSHPQSAPSKSQSIIKVNGKVYEKCYRRGKGGSSYVYECRSDDLQCQVAVKIVDLEEIDYVVKEGYMNEVKLLQKLHGNNHIIKLYDFELQDDLLYVVMELGEVDFLTYLNSSDTLEPLFIKVFFLQMLRCVKAIHDEDIVHSDLKPANFLLVKGHVKLIDFGISSQIPLNMSYIIKDHQAGTINYMSPESFYDPERGIELRKAADVWSLGCILYLMVFKTAPY
uniref:Protein kinase domain-containing protein n=1 Tax=Panagrolaimus sp. JU765 TaxID=591449 RepID=A0AC34R211_9BILA